MFVYYVDACLTAYWKLFVLSLWLVSLLFIAINARQLLRAGRNEKALQEARITGAAYEKLRPRRARYVSRLGLAAVASVIILYGYSEFFSTFRCTPDSFLWWAPEDGA
ncbi:MAG: hypothetical protein Tsb0032_44400 [Kiloniellaceae bacterium]